MRKGSTKGNDWERHGSVTLLRLEELKTKEEWWCYVDTKDFAKVHKFRWHAKRFKNAPIPYAASSRRIDGKDVTVLMHRYILGVTDPKIHVDHDNHNTLDNRRTNIKAATPKENALNRATLNSNNKTGVRGVHVSPSGKYAVYYCGRYLGVYEHIEDAIGAREFAANCKTDSKVARWL